MTETPKAVTTEAKNDAISLDKKPEVAAPKATTSLAENAEVAKK